MKYNRETDDDSGCWFCHRSSFGILKHGDTFVVEIQSVIRNGPCAPDYHTTFSEPMCVECADKNMIKIKQFLQSLRA